jgi:hypothetical protein
MAAAQPRAATSDAPPANADNPVTRLVKLDGEWREAEVYVVQPGRKAELRVDCPSPSTTAMISELAPKPGETRTFGLTITRQHRWTVPFGIAVQLDENRLEWLAPAESGHYRILAAVDLRSNVSVRQGPGLEKTRPLEPVEAQTTFHFLVPAKFDPEGSGAINGYPIGVYPREDEPGVKAAVASHRDKYKPPEWFVPVTAETADLRVSQHFRLREFIPNVSLDKTVYFPFNYDLVRMLQAIRAGLIEAEIKAPIIRIVRGYLSPYEADRLRRQGVSVLKWNRYQYGDAVLFIVDGNLDDKMDDVTGDGEVDVRDAKAVANVVRKVQDELDMPGWLGVFARRADQTLPETPMVGFDLRGWSVETIEVGGAPDEE